jgi:hypothetical protein
MEYFNLLTDKSNLEQNKEKNDPNGFCSVWCIWWIYERLLNLNLSNINNIANNLITQIKLDNKSFKELIRNFSLNICNIRDKFLKKYNLDINLWLLGNYSEEILNNLEKDILKLYL